MELSRSTSTFGIECLTLFNEDDLEHIACSDRAMIRPSGRVLLPDYFDAILKKVSWCLLVLCRIFETDVTGSEETEFRRSYHVKPTVPIRSRTLVTEEIVLSWPTRRSQVA